MFTKHYDQFNDAINQHGRTPDKFEEHDSLLWHEGKMYDLAKEYIEGVGDFTSYEIDYALRNIRWHVECILEYVGLSINPECVMYEMLDVQSARLGA